LLLARLPASLILLKSRIEIDITQLKKYMYIPSMTQTSKEQWIPCPTPAVADTIRWREPLWARPSKPRGKPDKIGEQMVTAKLIALNEPAELQVIEVRRLSLIAGAYDAPSKIKTNDMIRRRISSIKSGDCEKLVQEA
jgi:hypothetical protein